MGDLLKGIGVTTPDDLMAKAGYPLSSVGNGRELVVDETLETFDNLTYSIHRESSDYYPPVVFQHELLAQRIFDVGVHESLGFHSASPPPPEMLIGKRRGRFTQMLKEMIIEREAIYAARAKERAKVRGLRDSKEKHITNR